MSEPAEEGGRGRIGTAAVLVAAALPLLYLLPLVLSLLLVALPPRRLRTVVAGALGGAVAVVLLPAPSGVGAALLVWSVSVSAAFALAALLRPAWGFFPRALAAVAAGLGAAGGWLAAAGSWPVLDRAVRTAIDGLAATWTKRVAADVTDPAVARAFEASLRTLAEVQWKLFPAAMALQSLALLALGWWIYARFAPHEGRWAQLRPLREFRFSDHLVWVAIAGLLLVLLPGGGDAARVGANVLFFMGGLYALRGLGVILFTTRISPAVLAVCLAVLALSPLLQIVLVAALGVGLGDTWLDVRRRAALVPRA
ncbi:MAG TPA: DUF2232 domain-containing protein [Longimicrobiaceae bacterium]